MLYLHYGTQDARVRVPEHVLHEASSGKDLAVFLSEAFVAAFLPGTVDPAEVVERVDFRCGVTPVTRDHLESPNVDVRCFERGLGQAGKGGFGALLKQQGRKVVKVDNMGSCRNLNGRRIRHVDAEAQLRAHHAGSASESAATASTSTSSNERESAASAGTKRAAPSDPLTGYGEVGAEVNDSVASAVAAGIRRRKKKKKKVMVTEEMAVQKEGGGTTMQKKGKEDSGQEKKRGVSEVAKGRTD